MPWVLDLVYLMVAVLVSPWLVWRSIRTGRYRRHLGEKLFGRVPPLPPGPPVVWFHGVSVGEIHLLQVVVAEFRRRHPHGRIVISATTDSGLSEARAKFPQDTVIAWPLDFSWAVAGAFDAIRPALVVLAEAELWPNFLAAAARRRVPVAVINGRLSPRSFRRFSRFRSLAKRLLFDRVTAWGVQTEEYADRYRQLGVRNVTVTGSVKYDGVGGDRQSIATAALRELLGLTPGHRVLVAGSTHPPEERHVLDAARELLPRCPGLVVILVPRHPDRFDEVNRLCEGSGVVFLRRSRIVGALASPPGLVLWDTVGELSAVWGLADVGYVGGSLDGVRGGQSMIEPAGCGVPTVFGPHVWNFRDAARLLVDAGGAVMIRQAGELVAVIEGFLTDDVRRAAAGAAARRLVSEQQGATRRTLDLLDDLWPSAGSVGDTAP